MIFVVWILSFLLYIYGLNDELIHCLVSPLLILNGVVICLANLFQISRQQTSEILTAAAGCGLHDSF